MLAAGATRLLPQGSDGARKAVQHTRVEATDVDPQFESRRGDDRTHLAVEQLGFDLTTLVGQVAAPIRPNGVVERRRQHVADMAGDQLGAFPAPAEGNGAVSGLDESGYDRRGFCTG